MKVRLLGVLTCGIAILLMCGSVSAVSIAVPNGDFNDNSDGDLADVDIWNDGCCFTETVIQVDNALDKAPGDLVMRLGDDIRFVNPTVNTGVQFSAAVPKYILSVDVRTFSNADLTSSSGVSSVADEFGIIFRNMSSNQNIKQSPNNVPGLASDTWGTLTLELTAAEAAAHVGGDIGIRFYHNGDKGPGGGSTGNFIAVDNVTLEAVPEPAAAVLLCFGGMATLVTRRR